jgi:hypothetical protein
MESSADTRKACVTWHLNLSSANIVLVSLSRGRTYVLKIRDPHTNPEMAFDSSSSGVFCTTPRNGALRGVCDVANNLLGGLIKDAQIIDAAAQL